MLEKKNTSKGTCSRWPGCGHFKFSTHTPLLSLPDRFPFIMITLNLLGYATWHVDHCSPTRDCKWSLYHWIAREVLCSHFNNWGSVAMVFSHPHDPVNELQF